LRRVLYNSRQLTAWCGTTVFNRRHWVRRRTGLVVVNTKKILVLTGVALLVFFLVTQPTQSAGIVTSILTTLKDAAEAVILFVRSVFAG
jgi:hypothetical protein